MTQGQSRLATWAAVLGLVAICGGANSGDLQYNWRNGERYGYTFNVTQQSATANVSWTGGCVFAASSVPRVARKAEDDGPSGSGTGFVVSTQGHMVTCAHVVKGASKIEALIDGKRYLARVIATDKAHDLAVVQVAAKDLPVMELADSTKVELNQDVLAVGYPITSLVGENIKMTRGIISGINKARDSDTDTVFQVDAAINPGNSGGPVVNDSGQVIGVASAKLVIAEVSNVGFVVPSNDVARLLKDNNIPYTVKDASEALKNTELARRVTPSVVLLYVTEDPDLALAEKRVVEYRAFCQTAAAAGAANALQSQTAQGRFATTVYGEVSDYAGGKIFPLGAGEVTDLFMERLPEDGKKKWCAGRLLRLTLVIPQPAPPQQPAQMAPGPRVGPSRSPRTNRIGGPTHGSSHYSRIQGGQAAPGGTTVTILAAEIVTYQVASTAGNIMTIQKTYEFTTEPKAGQKPLLTIKGTGTVEFDLQAGMMKSMVMDLTEEVSAQGQSVQVPQKVSVQRVNPTEVRFPDGGTLIVSATPNNPSIGPSQPQRPSTSGPSTASSSTASSPPVSLMPGNQSVPMPKAIPIKLPAPSASAIAKAQELVESLFKKELDAAKTPAKKLELAKTLSEHAQAEKSDMTARYALLDKARQLAVDAAALDQAVDAVDELTAAFEVDSVKIKLDTITSLTPGDAPPEKQRAFAKVAMATFNEALEKDRFDLAKRAGSLAVAAARKSNDAKLTTRISELGQQYKGVQEAFNTASSAFETLKTDPENGPANSSAGRYVCFFKAEWEKGLKQLAKGTDSELKTLAQKELALRSNPEEQMAVADAWYDLADRYSSPAKDKLVAHAGEWYERALPGLSGLSKIKAEKRVVKADASSPADGSADGGAKSGGGTTRQALLERIRKQVKEQRVARTQEAGFTPGKMEAISIPEPGALLMGFDITHNGNRINSVRPIYLSEKGQTGGPLFGSLGPTTVKLIAKKGYAVGGMRIRGGFMIDGLSLTFMEIGAKGLDPSKSYQSDWIGGSGGTELQLAGSGAPVVGVIGHGSKSTLSALGLVVGAQE